MIRLMIVEDNEIVREGLVRLFGSYADISVLGTANDGLKAVELLKDGQVYDIILADLNMPEMDGIQLAKYVSRNFSKIKLIILTMHDKRVFVDKAKAAGAKGYVLKDVGHEELADVIRNVYKGSTHFV